MPSKVTPTRWEFRFGWGLGPDITIEVYPPGEQLGSRLSNDLLARGFRFRDSSPADPSGEPASCATYVKTLQGADDRETAKLALAMLDHLERHGMIATGNSRSIETHAAVAALLAKNS